MATTSVRTIRIRGISKDMPNDSFIERCKKWDTLTESKSIIPWTISSTPRLIETLPRKSLATQNDYMVATATFKTEDAKDRVLLQGDSDGWVLDDIFDGVTTLYSPSDINNVELDVCAVHGLQGNGFETWTAENGVMWLRDILPETLPFKEKSRIMTFGYSSQFRDNSNVSGVTDWADNLLSQERQRPIIFICHSLGGIVTREAMIRLNAHPEKYYGISVDQCGLLFLGTPHSGTVQADWNDFLAGIAAVVGIRTEILDNLRSFNGFGVESKEAFGSIPAEPPYYCLCETKLINVVGNRRLVVTKDSAGLNSAVAFPMPDVNHKEMCRFSHRFQPGYDLIVERLCRIRDRLLKQITEAYKESFEELPGHPTITAGRFPLPPGKRFYEGRGLLGKGDDRLVGRELEYRHLERITEGMLDGKAGHTAVAISGLGGIGKTELLLTLAYRHRNSFNIFFVRAGDKESLNEDYLAIANSVGSDILEKRHPGQNLYNLWASLDGKAKIDAFKFWLTELEMESTCLLIDDIDALPESAIGTTLPNRPRNLLITTRNPAMAIGLSSEFHLRFSHVRLTEMSSQDTTLLMSQTFESANTDNNHQLCSRVQAMELSKIASGHPLIASRLVFFITINLAAQHGRDAVSQFLKAAKRSPPERKVPAALFTCKAPFQDSILQNLEKSRQRLRDPNGHSWTLMQLIAFMVLNDAAYLKLLFAERPWIVQLHERLTYYEIWSAKNDSLQTWLSDIRHVSLGTAASHADPLSFHPVLIQCIQEQAEEDDRQKFIRDIALLASESLSRTTCHTRRDSMHKVFVAQVLHILNLCDIYGIDRNTLGLPENPTNIPSS